MDGLTCRARRVSSGVSATLKFSMPIALPPQSSLLHHPMPRFSHGRAFQAQVRALSLLHDQTLPDVQQLIGVDVIRHPSQDAVIGVLAMKFAEGEPLDIVRREMSPRGHEATIRLAMRELHRRVRRALYRIGGCGIFLEDVALDNIVVAMNVDGRPHQVTIIDFGSARFIHQSERKRAQRAMFGDYTAQWRMTI